MLALLCSQHAIHIISWSWVWLLPHTATKYVLMVTLFLHSYFFWISLPLPTLFPGFILFHSTYHKTHQLLVSCSPHYNGKFMMAGGLFCCTKMPSTIPGILVICWAEELVNAWTTHWVPCLALNALCRGLPRAVKGNVTQNSASFDILYSLTSGFYFLLFSFIYSKQWPNKVLCCFLCLHLLSSFSYFFH